MGLGFFLLWRGGQWLLDRLVYHNDSIAVRNLEVQTDGVMPLEQLRRWAGVKLGDNLMALDLARIKRDLELAPVIKEAAVERLLPSTLILRIAEREPCAEVRALTPRPDRRGYTMAAYYLDEAGYVMPPIDSQDSATQAGFTSEVLPVLTGLVSSDLRPGRPVESPAALAALRLIAAFDRSPMFGVVDLACIDLMTPEILQVTTGQGSKVTLALNNPEKQLRRWRAVYDYGIKSGKAIASLDLSVTNNLPVYWVEASQVPPPKPILQKPPRLKKKHV
jgi:hypothetical protein